MKYRIEYSNGVVVYKSFYDKWKLAEFLHNEGDHVVDCTRWNENVRSKL
jgi:hypothetical protein